MRLFKNGKCTLCRKPKLSLMSKDDIDKKRIKAYKYVDIKKGEI